MSQLSVLGPWAWPLGILSVLLVADSLRAGWRIGKGRGSRTPRAPHHTLLGWGALAAAVGLSGTASGLGRVAHGARVAAGGERAEVEAVLDVLEGGSIVALAPAGAGFALLGLAVVAWLALEYAWARPTD